MISFTPSKSGPVGAQPWQFVVFGTQSHFLVATYRDKKDSITVVVRLQVVQKVANNMYIRI